MSRRRRMLEQVGAVRVDTWLSLWAASVEAYGGAAVSGARQTIVGAFIAAEMASGAWERTDDYWAFWAEDAIQARTSLKQRRLATLIGTPTFTTDRDYTTNGSNNGLNLGFIPSIHGVALTLTSSRIAGYERTNVTGNTFMAGCVDANQSFGPAIRLRPRNGANAIGELMQSGTATYTLPAANSQGYIAASRFGTGLTDVVGYKNGVAMTRTTDPTSYKPQLPGTPLYVGGYNNTGPLTTPRATVAGFLAVGGALSPEQEADQYDNVQTWGTAVGAAV